MPYLAPSCDCSNNLLMKSTAQCKSCGSGACNGCYDEIRQKRMWNQVRASSSIYTMNKAALNVTGTADTFIVNWNQASDRANASVGTAFIPSRGSTTRGTVTRNRPGASGPAGTGVDIKHNSYARYLARKKGPNLKTGAVKTPATVPVKGNKSRTFGMIANCTCSSS